MVNSFSLMKLLSLVLTGTARKIQNLTFNLVWSYLCLAEEYEKKKKRDITQSSQIFQYVIHIV